MATANTLDTYEFIKALKEEGFSEKQAAAITRTASGVARAVRSDELDDVATDQDLRDVAKELEDRMLRLNGRTNALIGVATAFLTFVITYFQFAN